MGSFTFNGITSTSVGIQVAHPPMYIYPEKDYEAVHVPGRNGDIIIDQGSYKNVPRSYEITVYDVNQPDLAYSERMVKLSNWLHSASGYAKLSDTYDAGYFRLARYYEQTQEIENILNQGGTGEIEFDCRPERFLDSGAETITINRASSGTSSGILKNPTQYASKPYIRIVGTTGSGSSAGSLTGTLRFNNQGTGVYNVFTITGASVTGGTPEVIIDSDLQIVTSNSEASFTYTLYEGFPTLPPPDQTISNKNITVSWLSSSNFTLVEVIPRWYII